MWGDGDDRIRPGTIGIDAQRAIDLGQRVAELSHERDMLRIQFDHETDSVISDLIVGLRQRLREEMERLQRDPCGVLGRARVG